MPRTSASWRETGPIAPIVLPTPLSVSDPRLQYKAVRLGSLREVLGCMLQFGIMDVGFVGGAEIDQFGNINTTVIGDYRRPKVRFPGSGGGNDILSHAKRILIITKHEKQRFPEHCTYITSPGYLGGPDGRKRAGLTSKTPQIVVVTTAGRHGDQSGDGEVPDPEDSCRDRRWRRSWRRPVSGRISPRRSTRWHRRRSLN